VQERRSFGFRNVFSSSIPLYVGLLAAGALLILLTNEHRALRSRYERLGENLRSPLPGLWFPAIETESVRGDTICIGSEAALPQLLLFFTTSCETCPETFSLLEPFFEGLLSEGDARVVGVAFDSLQLTRTFVEERNPAFPVTVFEHPRWPDVFRIREVPQLVVLDTRGRVRIARTGAFSRQLLADSIVPFLRQHRSDNGSPPSDDLTPICEATKTIHLRQGRTP